MPLRKCLPKNQYQYYFITGGPWHSAQDYDSLRTQLRDVIINHIGANRVKNLQIALEISENEYKHFHCALQSFVRWPLLAKKLLKVIKTWPRDPTETRRPNVAFHYVPQGVSNPWLVMTQYLGSPSKYKETDDDILEFTSADKWWLDAAGQVKPDTAQQPYNTAAYWHYNYSLMRGETVPVPFDPKLHLTKLQRDNIRWAHMTDAQRQQENEAHHIKSRALFLNCLNQTCKTLYQSGKSFPHA